MLLLLLLAVRLLQLLELRECIRLPLRQVVACDQFLQTRVRQLQVRPTTPAPLLLRVIQVSLLAPLR